MGFLQRSKSAGVTVQKSKKHEKPLESAIFSAREVEEKRSTSYERPTTGARQRSFSRPRTANAAIGRDTEFEVPSFKIDIKAGDEIFSFPTPSPRLPPPKSAAGQLLPSALRESEVAAIGVAIGSPGHPGPPWNQLFSKGEACNTTSAVSPPTRLAPVLPEHPDLEMPLTDIRKKKSSWKTLGGLFGRKAAKATPEEEIMIDHGPHELPRLNTEIASAVHLAPQRSPSMTRTQARFEARCEADRAAFTRTTQPKALRSPSMIQKEGLSPMFRSINGIPEDNNWVDDPRKDSPLSMMSTKSFRAKDEEEAIAVPGTPTLVLDLPDPKFDRYSVMFEKVLEDSRPSLLERRQSRLRRSTSVKKLDLSASVDEPPPVPRLEVNGLPQRSATSPGLKKSLSARLGKKALSPVIEAFTSLNPPRALRRSRTAPSSSSPSLAKAFSDLKLALQGNSPTTAEVPDLSLPATPMTVGTISELDEEDDLPFEIEKAEAAWSVEPQTPIEEAIDPYLRVKQMERQIVQISAAQNISVSEAMTLVRKSIAWRHPVRPKVVELNKNRGSAFVVIESV